MNSDAQPSRNGYAPVNGIQMYYEVYGSGQPLTLIHGGASTIHSTFGRVISRLSAYFQVIAMDLQNHGRSGFRSEAQTFDQDAHDVIKLLDFLHIEKTSVLGFSNGGTTALKMAYQFPHRVERLVAVSAAVKRTGLLPGFFDGMKQVTLEHMPEPLKTEFLKVRADHHLLQQMFEKDRDRMLAYEDESDENLRKITTNTLVVNSTQDVTTLDHALEISALIPNSGLVVLPGVHGQCLGEVTTLQSGRTYDYTITPVVLEFLGAQ